VAVDVPAILLARNDHIAAPCLFDGSINGERFRAYVSRCGISFEARWPPCPTASHRSIAYLTNALRLPMEPFARRFPNMAAVAG
jgi:hypothetical protein